MAMEKNVAFKRILVIGAHPDDCEFTCGGTAVKWVRQGHRVCLLSVTNGQSGHHEMDADKVADCRASEAAEAAAVAGVESMVLPLPDGALTPSLENRLLLIRKIRQYGADVVLTHRPNDYHPDHRYSSQLVQDASFLLTVPQVAAEVEPLDRMPIIFYLTDRFQKPVPFSPDVAVDIGDVFDVKVRMLHAHASQVYEWLPWLGGYAAKVPGTEPDRLEWLARQVRMRRSSRISEVMRQLLVSRYGPEKGNAVNDAEAFELCEYGYQPNEKELAQVFHGL